MKKILLAAILSGFAMAAPAHADLLSTFDAGAEGWNAVDPTGDYTSSWSSTGGNPGGFLLGTESNALGGDGYFYAPAGWLGNWSAYAGGTVSYDIKVISGTAFFSDPDIILSNGGTSVSWTGVANPVGDGWVTISVGLNNANFGSNLSSVLSNVTSFSIRGELIDGVEQEGIDNIKVSAATPSVPEPASWAMLVLGLGAVGFVQRQRTRLRLTTA